MKRKTLIRKYSTDNSGDLTSASRLQSKIQSIIIEENKNEDEKELTKLLMTNDEKFIQDLEDSNKKDLIGIMLTSKVKINC